MPSAEIRESNLTPLTWEQTFAFGTVADPVCITVVDHSEDSTIRIVAANGDVLWTTPTYAGAV